MCACIGVGVCLCVCVCGVLPGNCTIDNTSELLLQLPKHAACRMLLSLPLLPPRRMLLTCMLLPFAAAVAAARFLFYCGLCGRVELRCLLWWQQQRQKKNQQRQQLDKVFSFVETETEIVAITNTSTFCTPPPPSLPLPLSLSPFSVCLHFCCCFRLRLLSGLTLSILLSLSTVIVRGRKERCCKLLCAVSCHLTVCCCRFAYSFIWFPRTSSSSSSSTAAAADEAAATTQRTTATTTTLQRFSSSFAYVTFYLLFGFCLLSRFLAPHYNSNTSSNNSELQI